MEENKKWHQSLVSAQVPFGLIGFLALTGARKVTLCVRLSLIYSNSLCNVHAILIQSLRIILAIFELSSLFH